MFEVDDNFLKTAGHRNLSPEDRQKLIKKYQEEINYRINRAIASEMNAEQLEDFNKFNEIEDKPQLELWLNDNFPNYKENEAYAEIIKTDSPSFEELQAFAQLLWFGRNLPDLTHIVSDEVELYLKSLIAIRAEAEEFIKKMSQKEEAKG